MYIAPNQVVPGEQSTEIADDYEPTNEKVECCDELTALKIDNWFKKNDQQIAKCRKFSVQNLNPPEEQPFSSAPSEVSVAKSVRPASSEISAALQRLREHTIDEVEPKPKPPTKLNLIPACYQVQLDILRCAPKMDRNNY